MGRIERLHGLMGALPHEAPPFGPRRIHRADPGEDDAADSPIDKRDPGKSAAPQHVREVIGGREPLKRGVSVSRMPQLLHDRDDPIEICLFEWPEPGGA